MQLVHKELCYRIIGALYRVDNELGYGHRERVYQKAVALSLTEAGLAFEKEKRIGLRFQDTCVGNAYLDFMIEQAVILELKARAHFRSADFKQMHRYLRSTDKQLGILASFTPTGVRYKRIVNIYS